jgi:type I restriction enzyme M protein
LARRKKNVEAPDASAATVGFEAELWWMADALRGSTDAAEYKHVVLGLIFLKSISDAFEERHKQLEAERAQGADPEDPDKCPATPRAAWSTSPAQDSRPLVTACRTGLCRGKRRNACDESRFYRSLSES